jgi:WD40 repeat protein
VEWLPDGSGLVSVDQSGAAIVWDLTSLPASSLPLENTADSPVTHAQFGNDAVLLAGRSGDGILADASTGQTIVEFGLAEERQDANVLANETAGIFVAPSEEGLRLYDVGERRWTQEFLIDGIERPLALSDDGTKLLAGTSTGEGTPATVMIDTTTGAVQWQLDRFFTDSALIDGDTVVLGGFRGRRLVNRLLGLDAATGEPLFESTRSWATSAMATSPDGRRLATERSDGRTTIYDLDLLVDSPTGQAVVVSTESADEPATRLVYSPDGRFLFGGGSDGVIRAWNAETLDELWSIDMGASASGLRVHDDRLWFGVPFDAPVGAGDSRFGLGAIPLDRASIVEWAATTVSRELTDFECMTYLNAPCRVREN